MNYENLNTLIDRYEANLASTMGTESHEQFKWQAVKIFRDAWDAPDAMDLPFPVLFSQARKGCGWLMDASTMSPTSGIVKMAEKEPEAVKELFLDLRSASPDEDLSVRRGHMTDFADRIEQLRQKLFPRNWKYKHDFHSVSCYMTFFAPEQNFIYKASCAKLMAQYIGFETPFGSGMNVDLAAYYQMCESILAVLKERESLCAKVNAYLDDTCYHDESLHLMTFDFIYCCWCYGYFKGLTYMAPVTAKASKAKEKAAKEKELLEEKRIQAEKHIAELQEQLDEMTAQLADLESVSMVGIEVSADGYGKGMVIDQKENRIDVQFEEKVVSFVIHRDFSRRPTFENEQEVVELLSNRYDLLKKKEKTEQAISWEKEKMQKI